MLWQPESSSSGLWMSTESVGDAGSNALGYFGGVFSPDGSAIVAHGFTGALHLWRRSAAGQWEAAQCVGGHFGAVVDCCWALGGDCLLSASTDQTARITTVRDGSWFEVARPQVHGHDFSCLAALPQREGGALTGFKYISGSEEKVLRVFQAPAAFASSIHRLRGDSEMEDGTMEGEGVALGAAVAALGLSNKAVFSGDERPAAGDADAGGYEYGPEMAPNPQPRALDGPPYEEELAQSTLWPEVRKVFGHGNDLVSAAADPRGAHCATACRAQNPTNATIWVWNTGDWSCAAKLKAHTLTATALEYSPDGGYLLSASRDRSFALFRRNKEGAEGPEPYALVIRRQKAHERIVWGVSWAPGGSGAFATCSRDRLVKLWSADAIVAAAGAQGGEAVQPLMQLPAFPSAVTAIGFAAGATDACPILAVGLEEGGISVWRVQLETCQSEQLWAAPPEEAHCAPVRRLRWQLPPLAHRRPALASAAWASWLASCGEDHKIRVFELSMA